MAFSVLKPPGDPRNFIVGPAPGTTAPVDPALIQAGLVGGSTVGLPGNRPQIRQFTGQELDPDVEAQRFGGPGDPRQFKRGLINLHGRLLKKTFERDKAAMWEDFARGGGIRTPEVEAQVNTALRSRGGFDAATDVLMDFRDQQPDRVAQREADLLALQQQATRKARNEKLTNDKLQNELDDHRVFMGMPPQTVRDDRNRVSTLKRIAKRQQDAMVLLQQFGRLRGPTFTDADLAAVKREYEDIVRETTAEVAAGHEAGALTDNERDYYTEFSPRLVGITTPIQISEARVALNNLMEYFTDKGTNTIRNNRALREGSFPEVWDIGEPRPWQDIISLETLKEGDIPLTADQIAAARQQQAQQEAVERGVFEQAEGEPDFFTGMQELIAPPSLIAPGGRGRAPPTRRIDILPPGAPEGPPGETPDERRRRLRDFTRGR